MTLDELKVRVKKMRPNLPTDEIISALHQLRLKDSCFEPSEVVKTTGLEISVVLVSLLMLVDEPLNLLKGFWILYEKTDDSLVNVYAIDEDDIIEAVKTGRLRHPETGSYVDDYVEKLGLVYQFVQWPEA